MSNDVISVKYSQKMLRFQKMTTANLKIGKIATSNFQELFLRILWLEVKLVWRKNSFLMEFITKKLRRIIFTLLPCKLGLNVRKLNYKLNLNLNLSLENYKLNLNFGINLTEELHYYQRLRLIFTLFSPLLDVQLALKRQKLIADLELKLFSQL